MLSPFYQKRPLRPCTQGLLRHIFCYYCLVWGRPGVTKNSAAQIVTGKSFDTPCQPLIKELGWKTIDQLITSETNIMVYKSLHELAPQYTCRLSTRTSQLTSRCLRNTLNDLRLPKKSLKTSFKCFSFRGAKAWNGLC